MNTDCGKAYGTRDYLVEDFSSPPKIVVRSPLFENSPRRSYSTKVRSSGLKEPGVSSDGELPPGWRTAEEQQRTLLSRKYLSPRTKHFQGFAASSDEDCSRSLRAAKPSYPGVQFATTDLRRQPYLQEHDVKDKHSESKGRRRLSEGNYSLRYGNCSVVSSRKSDSDIFGRGMGKISSSLLVEEGEMIPETRIDGCRNIRSLLSEGARGESVLDVSQEDLSESELKRTRMESTGSEAYTKQRRCKIRVLEESEDLNIQWKDGTSCGIGSGGIGRGRIVQVKELCTQNGVDSNQHLPRESSHYEVGNMRSTDDPDDYIQKCRKWSVAETYNNVDGNLAPRKWGRFEDGSDGYSEAHDCKPPRYASLESALDVSKSLKWSKPSDPVTVSPKNLACKVDMKNNSATDQSSSELDSKTDSQGANSDGISSLRHRDAGQRLSLIQDSVVIGKASHGQLEGKSRRKSSSEDRCYLSQGSDAAISCYKSSTMDIGMKTRKSRYDCTTSTVTADRGKDIAEGSPNELRKKRKSRRKRRSQSPTAAVACAASMIGDTVEAVRKVREDAAELAFKLAELHAHDARALRSAAAVMRHHVDSLETEVHSFQSKWDKRDVVEFPWQFFLREFVVAASLVSGVFSVHACINSVRKAFGSLKQTASRREKLVLAAVLLSVGLGTGFYHGLGQVKSVRRDRDKQLRAHLKCIMERTSLLSTLAHTDPTSSPLETSTDVEDDRQSMVYSR